MAELDDLLTEDELFGGGEGGTRRLQPVRESTADLIRYRVRQFASALVLDGIMPAHEIAGLKTLVAPHTVNAGLKFFIKRAGGRQGGSAKQGYSSEAMLRRGTAAARRTKLWKRESYYVSNEGGGPKWKRRFMPQ